jgi:phage terminase small subunit
MTKFIEQETPEDIHEIVRREVTRLKNKPSLENNDVAVLEKLSKIYSVLMASYREDLKHGIFGKLSEDQLKELVGEDSEETNEDEEILE